MKYIIKHTIDKSFNTIEEARSYRDTITTGKVMLIVSQEDKHLDT